ncbi:MAG: DUF2258 domain-containing protein [Crenarchaeota archaeon]|nr:DUF2258 domain-containing protein [Thermoproteota archaeon]
MSSENTSPSTLPDTVEVSTGLVYLSGYADKLRRAMFAALKNHIKQKIVTQKEVAYKVGIMNKILYEVLISRMKLDRHDIVRIRARLSVRDGAVIWDFASVSFEIWRRSPSDSEKAKEIFEEVLAEEQFMSSTEYSLVKLGTTSIGEEIYEITDSEGKKIGAVKVIPTDDTAIVIGATITPPLRIRATVPKASLEYSLSSIIRSGEEITVEQAEEIINSILKELDRES